ncbi:MAG TPA: DNA polymerase Y family protein, partial [Gammaproteobacteria bacterium]
MSVSSALKGNHHRLADNIRSEPDKTRAGRTQGGSPESLWLAVYLPQLSLEALCRGERLSRPSVAIAGDRARARVIAADNGARKAGICSGMLFSAACALVPTLIGLAQDKEEESAAIDGLAAWSGQFTSFVSVEQQGLLLEIGGSLKLFGGLKALCAEIQAGIHALGYTASTGVAPTPAGAWLLARAGFDVPVVSPVLLSGRLAPVPVECMDLPASALE